ncbi:MAG: hypothetical protein ACRDJW_07960 [Thermomicrobiales bacterium]
MASLLVLLAATLWLFAAVAITRVPRIAAVLYLLAALTCAAGARDEPDLWAWAATSLGLAIFSFRCRQIESPLSPIPA